MRLSEVSSEQWPNELIQSHWMRRLFLPISIQENIHHQISSFVRAERFDIRDFISIILPIQNTFSRILSGQIMGKRISIRQSNFMFLPSETFENNINTMLQSWLPTYQNRMNDAISRYFANNYPLNRI